MNSHRPSNHVQNGVLLTEEFHTLFDRGYVTITPASGAGTEGIQEKTSGASGIEQIAFAENSRRERRPDVLATFEI